MLTVWEDKGRILIVWGNDEKRRMLTVWEDKGRMLIVWGNDEKRRMLIVWEVVCVGQ